MKQIGILLLFLSTVLCRAQQVDSSILSKVRENKDLQTLQEGYYRFKDNISYTPAPKGYKPFYLSSYSRHGSRHFYSEWGFKTVYENLCTAAAEDNLTPEGKELFKTYSDFYNLYAKDAGSLLDRGYNEHFRLGERVCGRFPQIFRKDARVDMLSSTSFRVIMSMSAAGQGLRASVPSLQIMQRSTQSGMNIITSVENVTKAGKRYQGESGIPKEHASHFQARLLDEDAFLGKYFKDSSKLSHGKNKETFILYLYLIITNYHNFESEPLFDDVFSKDEYMKMWEVANFLLFQEHAKKMYNLIPLMDDITSKAQDAIEGRGNDADMRFGHDYVMDALYYFLNINGCMATLETPEDVKYHFQGYCCPMACNMQIVLYRNRRCEDVLFKVLWNEEEVSLPQFESVSGPYYRWDDFVSWMDIIKKEHPLVPFYEW